MKEKINVMLRSKMMGRTGVFHAVFSALFALMIVFGRHVFDESGDKGTVLNVYFTDLSITDLLLWLLIATAVFLLVSFIPKLKKEWFFKDERSGKGILSFVIPFLLISICYVPYVMSYWPGGIYNDTVGSMEIALGISDMTSHEPVGYTLLWKLMFAIAGGSFEPGDYGALYMFTVVQCLALAYIFASFISWLYRRGLKAVFAVIMSGSLTG